MKSKFFQLGSARSLFATAVVILASSNAPAADGSPTPNKPSSSASSPVISANGFAIHHEIQVRADPEKVWTSLVDEVGAWWKPEHTFSGDSKNLSIDPRPGGCFCERLPNGGGVEHLRVLQSKPGELLRFSGTLGPLQASGLAGSLTLKLSNVEGSTKIELSYIVGGFMEAGFEKIAPAVDLVLKEQLARLKNFVETGKPD